MSQTRIIKKYPNRRLYDTEESRYITLADVRRLVLESVAFCVVDQKSGDDITRSILLQVISEQEANGEPIMTEDFLAQMIRAYHRAMPQFIGQYLEQSLGLFLRQQQEVRQRMASMMDLDPMGPVREMTRRNWNRWIDVQQDVLKAFIGAGSQEGSGGADAAEAGGENRRAPGGNGADPASPSAAAGDTATGTGPVPREPSSGPARRDRGGARRGPRSSGRDGRPGEEPGNT